jgi:hypothetical protein
MKMTKKTKTTDKKAKKKAKGKTATKTLSPMPLTVTSAQAVSAAPAKRGRGRPRTKNVVVVAETVNVGNPATTPVVTDTQVNKALAEMKISVDVNSAKARTYGELFTPEYRESLGVDKLDAFESPVLEKHGDELALMSAAKEPEKEERDPLTYQEIAEELKKAAKHLEEAANSIGEEEDHKAYAPLAIPSPWYKRWWTALVEFWNSL